MGKGILITSLGASLLVTFLVLKLNANSNLNLQTTLDKYLKTQARLIANSGVEIYLEQLRRNKSLTGNFNDNQLFGGEYDINISGPDSALIITSVADFQGVKHTTIVNARRDMLPFPSLPGAMYVTTNAITYVKMNGNFSVSGYDHDINGNLVAGTPLPGISVDNKADSSAIRNVLKGSADVDGKGGKPSIWTTNNNIDWEALANEVIYGSDITINSSNDLKNYANLGTLSVPKATFINGNIQLNSNLSGAGILVVNGDIQINGSFSYLGIVIAYKDTKITTQLNGNGKVYGGMIIAGSEANLEISNGNFKCYYSTEALNNAKMNLKSSRFKIVHWWE
ncbi:MAG: hypothetical protein HXY49_10820 [Ignavibacteriaceae bacterium]|nr:hypothetical protein [Ignavibacteriaceae bacterium]